MKFEDITFYVTIGMAIINIAGALRKIAKIKNRLCLFFIRPKTSKNIELFTDA